MESFQERVVDELDELEQKLIKLEGFLNTALFEDLPSNEQALLMMQA